MCLSNICPQLPQYHLLKVTYSSLLSILLKNTPLSDLTLTRSPHLQTISLTILSSLAFAISYFFVLPATFWSGLSLQIASGFKAFHISLRKAFPVVLD